MRPFEVFVQQQRRSVVVYTNHNGWRTAACVEFGEGRTHDGARESLLALAGVRYNTAIWIHTAVPWEDSTHCFFGLPLIRQPLPPTL